jgi:hypothetical protein
MRPSPQSEDFFSRGRRRVHSHCAWVGSRPRGKVRVCTCSRSANDFSHPSAAGFGAAVAGRPVPQHMLVIRSNCTKALGEGMCGSRVFPPIVCAASLKEAGYSWVDTTHRHKIPDHWSSLPLCKPHSRSEAAAVTCSSCVFISHHACVRAFTKAHRARCRAIAADPHL